MFLQVGQKHIPHKFYTSGLMLKLTLCYPAKTGVNYFYTKLIVCLFQHISFEDSRCAGDIPGLNRSS